MVGLPSTNVTVQNSTAAHTKRTHTQWCECTLGNTAQSAPLQGGHTAQLSILRPTPTIPPQPSPHSQSHPSSEGDENLHFSEVSVVLSSVLLSTLTASCAASVVLSFALYSCVRRNTKRDTSTQEHQHQYEQAQTREQR
jgi:hypothetical protein